MYTIATASAKWSSAIMDLIWGATNAASTDKLATTANASMMSDTR